MSTIALKTCVNCGKGISQNTLCPPYFHYQFKTECPLRCVNCGEKCCAQCAWKKHFSEYPCQNRQLHNFVED